MAVDSVAVQYAGVSVPLAENAAAVGTQFAEPRLALPFVKETMPVGPAPLLLVCTCAVNVTVAPDVTGDGPPTSVCVVAFVIVTDSALLALP